MSFLSRLLGGAKTISAEEAHGLMEGDVIILDVRTREEYQTGHIRSSLLIPVDELSARAEKELPNKKILVYCQSGMRAVRAVHLLSDMGYEDVVSFGGIAAWPYEII